MSAPEPHAKRTNGEELHRSGPLLRPAGILRQSGECQDDLLDEWQLFGVAGGWSPNTVKCRRDALTKLARDSGTPLHELSALQVARWLSRYTAAWSRKTNLAHCRSFFGWLVRSGYRADDPTTAIPRSPKPRGAPRPVSTQQLEEALDGASWHPFAYITIAAYSGLRVHEVAKVRGEDLDLTAATLRVNGKGGKEAVLPLSPKIADLARHYPARGYWFPGSDNGHITAGWVSTSIRRAFAQAGHQMTAHQLRHWFGTEILRASGGNLRTTQECMRHASVASTEIYTLVEDSQRSAAVLALP